MAYRSSSSNALNSGTASTTVPAGSTTDDIVILACAVDNTSEDLTSKWPANFTPLVANSAITADGHRWGCAWKRLTTADAGSYTMAALADTIHDWTLHAVCFSGRHTTNAPVNSTVATQNTPQSSPVSVAANGVTAVTGDDLLWLSVPDVTASGIGNLHTDPSGFTEAQDNELAWVNMGTSYQNNVSSGATGTITGSFALTSGTAGYAALLIRIPAAAAAATAPPPATRKNRTRGLYLR